MTESDPERRIPKLDHGIEAAADHDMLVLFVGAGVSRLVGCKGWEDFALDLLKLCYKKKFITYRAFKELESLTDHRQLITICYHLLEKSKEEDLFRQELQDALEPHGEEKFRHAFEYLATMRHFCIVTTNADANLDKCFPDKQRIVARMEEFPPEPHSGFLYHLHGSIAEGNEVFTLKQYFDQYNKGRTNVQSFLKNLFGNYHILFLGYGLSEFEILEFIFRQPKTAPRSSYRHFMLINDSADGFRKSYLRSYYKDMNIKLISYNTDVRGYDELYYVIKDWSRQLQPVRQYSKLPGEQEQLRELATRAYDKTVPEEVWMLLRKPDLESFFFSTLSDSNYGICLSWLRPLDRHEFFSPASHPSLRQEQASGPPGEVFWSPIGYLHRVTESAIKAQDTKTLEIIADIGSGLIQVQAKAPSKKYDWRTNHFILQALMVSKKTLSEPVMREAALHLMIVESSSLSLRMAVSDELIKLLIQQANGIALKMILRVFLRGMAKQPEGAQNELAWHFEKAIVPHAAELVRVCGPEIVRMCAATLRVWQRELGSGLTCYEVPSVEESDQNRDQGHSAPMAIVRFVRAACDQMPPEQLKAMGRQFLASRAASILRRIGYDLVNVHYDAMATMFWQVKRNPLLDEDAFHEVFMLLFAHAPGMNGKQVGVVLQWLKKAELAWGREVGTDNSIRAALKQRFKAKWLLSLRANLDMRVQSLFNASWEGHPLPAHPEWNFYVGEAERDTTGLVTVAILQGFETNEQLAAFLNATDVSSGYGALREMASSDPERLIRNGLNGLLGIPIDFLQALFNGFVSAIQNKRTFQVVSALQLGKSALTRLERPSEDASTKEDRRGACRSICEFVSIAVRNESVSWVKDGKLAQDLVQEAVEVASKYPVTDPGLKEPRWRLSSSALAAAVQATIWVAWGLTETGRRSDQSSSRIPEWAAKLLDNVLNFTDPTLQSEAREGIAADLYVLNILDPDWVAVNLDRIFPKELPDQWDGSFAAYLRAPVYKQLFLLLRDRGEYSVGLGRGSPDENTGQALAAHVSLAYISGLDSHSRLMDEMLRHGGKARLSEVIWYFANPEREWTARKRAKLLPLWRRMIVAIGRLRDQGDRTRLVSSLPMWLNAFEMLPTRVEKLLESSFSDWEHDSSSEPEILESLARFVNRDAERVGNILLTALDKNVVLRYPEEALVKIAKTLRQQEFVSKAEEIHAKYFERGVYAMGPVLKK